MPDIVSLQRANHGNRFRAYGLRNVAALIDPFIGIDHAWMSGPTFPPHSHAGFSAVSYVFLDSETGIHNRDNIGTENTIFPGGMHWTMAGRGIVHEEVPAESGKTVHALQIFVDLPAERKHKAPSALTLAPQDVPVLVVPGAKVRIPAGSFSGISSPLTLPTDVMILDISLDEKGEISVPVEAGCTAFVMPIFGSTMVNGDPFDLNHLKVPVFPACNTAHTLTLKAYEGSSKLMVFSGPPLRNMAI